MEAPPRQTPAWNLGTQPRVAIRRIECISVTAFFLLVGAIGLLIVEDFGISWDEPANRTNGLVSANYAGEYLFGSTSLSETTEEITKYHDRDYGVVFELLLLAVEHLTGVTDSRALYLQRHRLTFGLCWLGLVAFYALQRRVHRHWQVALAGCVLFVLTPRFMAHSFYNSKDMAAVVFTIVNLYTMIRFVERPSVTWSVAHGVTTAVAIATRVAMVYLPVVTLMGLALAGASLLAKPARLGRRHRWKIVGTALRSTLLYFAVTATVGVLIWPYLWEQSLHRFVEVFRLMSQYWWDSTVLYKGEYLPAAELPKSYLPVWMAITIPLLHTLLFFAGLLRLATRLVTGRVGPWTLDTERSQVLFLLTLLVPPAAVVVLGSVLYDGWRQLYFIYPSYLCLSVYGLAGLWLDKSWFPGVPTRHRHVALAVIVAVGLCGPALFIARGHPHQCVYFNALVKRPVFGRFELDYWGLSSRAGLEYILDADPSESIPVALANQTGVYNLLILPPRERARIRIVPLEEASYYIAHYRWRDTYDNLSAGKFPYCNEVFSVTVGGSRLSSVFELPEIGEARPVRCPER